MTAITRGCFSVAGQFNLMDLLRTCDYETKTNLLGELMVFNAKNEQILYKDIPRDEDWGDLVEFIESRSDKYSLVGYYSVLIQYFEGPPWASSPEFTHSDYDSTMKDITAAKERIEKFFKDLDFVNYKIVFQYDTFCGTETGDVYR